jgi:radical SAM superfamily enzyme YgiQ (UPF0313 family)
MENKALPENELDIETHFTQAKIKINELFQGRTIKKVLLVSPPDIEFSLFDYGLTKRGRSNNYPPYGLAVLGRHLLNQGLEVQICNLNHEILKRCQQSSGPSDFDFEDIWKTKLTQEMKSFQPDFIGGTCLFTVTHPSLVRVCQEVKQIPALWLGENVRVPLAIGGVHVTHDVDNILDDLPEADFAFLNEAELAFTRFIEIVNQKRPVEDLSQIIINIPENRLHFQNPSLPEPEDLNIIPAFELMPVKENSRVGALGSWYGFIQKETPIATVLSNRGCRAACTFCNVRTFNGVGVRHRSVDSVLEELTVLKNEHGVGHIIWLDDDLLHDEKRAISLFNGIVRRNLGMTWDATNGVIASSCKNEVIAAAAESGCIGMYFGIESGNPKILKEIKKPGTVEVFLRAAEVLHNYEQINTKGFLMFGFPGETLRMMFDTISLAETMNLDWYNVAVLQPWKATPIYATMLEQGLLEVEGELKTKDNEFAPYNLGPYSRQRAIEKGLIVSDSDYFNSLSHLSLDSIPSPETLDDIWFYMNYRINFFRLLGENRPLKLEQGLKWMNYLHHLSAPDNGFIMYYLGFLQHRVRGEVDPALIEKLDKRLQVSTYWRERFALFSLSVDHLKQGEFPFNFDEGKIRWHLPEAFWPSSSKQSLAG